MRFRSDQTEDEVAMGRLALIVQMRQRGVSWRRIGLLMNCNESTLRGRYEALTPETRRFYAELSLRSLGL